MKFIDMLEAMDRDNLITGQLFFRGHSPAVELDLSNREVFSVVGNIAVPKDLIKSEHQYVIAGYNNNVLGVTIGLDQINGVDFKTKYHGFNIGQLLTEPIWRV